MSDAPPAAPSDSPPTTTPRTGEPSTAGTEPSGARHDDPESEHSGEVHHSHGDREDASGDLTPTPAASPAGVPATTGRRRLRRRKVQPQHAAPPTKGQRAARSAVEWIAIIAAALLVAFVVKTFLIQAFSIPSASMEPRLTNGDRVFVNKMSYRLHDINRGDIVVFERPPCDTGSETDHLIKRVIAMEGETVEARSGRLLIDGRALDEPYLPPGVETENFGPVVVPPDRLWVMGDNRINSKDSRFLCNGGATFIAEDSVVGRAFVRVWPIGDLTLL